MARPVWFVWSTGYKNDCALFETRDGAVRHVYDIPHSVPIDSRHQQHWTQDNTVRFGYCGRAPNGPLWVVVANGKAELYETLADVVKGLTRKPPPPDALAWNVLQSLPHHGHGLSVGCIGALCSRTARRTAPRWWSRWPQTTYCRWWAFPNWWRHSCNFI